ncbi:cytochrome b [Rhodobacteraceae bacterium NNCM2]|nr:cytochrome b [Coraliihabitans acroporae]
MFSDSYSLVQRLLHWTIAILVLILLLIGVTIDELGFDGLTNLLGAEGRDTVYNLHKSFGILVLELMILRVAARLLMGRPEYSEPLPLFNRIASEAVHGLLYLALLAMPVIGWLATASGGYPVEFFFTNMPALVGKDEALSKMLFEWHGILGRAIMVLITVHILAALYHWRVKRDRIMGRMSLF